MTEEKRELYVREQATGETIHRVDVTGKTEREIEKLERGMLRNMDTDRFVLCDSATDEPDPSPETIGAPRP